MRPFHAAEWPGYRQSNLLRDSAFAMGYREKGKQDEAKAYTYVFKREPWRPEA